MRDPQLIAEGAKMDLELGFVAGVDVQALVERLYKSSPEVIARARRLWRPTSGPCLSCKYDL